MKTFRVFTVLAAVILLAVSILPSQKTQVVSAEAACADSTPVSAAYTVEVCLTAPAGGSSLAGDAPVSATATVTGTSPGVQRMVFYLNGGYMLTDYQSPYTFSLPTTRWVDGAYTLAVEALMRDAFTSTQAVETINFNNGVTQAPVNNKSFTPAAGTAPAAGAPFVVMAAGDGASGEVNSTNVINLIAGQNPNMFLYLGDVYEKGYPVEFYNWYGNAGSNYSRFRAITNPTIGNHEYDDILAPSYFDYWDNIPKYYSFNAGGWHFISLNANHFIVGVTPTSAQYIWLQQDLATNANLCTVVYYHQPLFNIGPAGPTTQMADIWALLAQNHVTMVLNGHDHTYQRWVPLDGNGLPNAGGITEFVVGTGGHGLQTIAGSDSRVAYANSNNPEAFGALRMVLSPTGVNFRYISVINAAVLDSGSVPCTNPQADFQAPAVPSGLTAKVASKTQVDLSWIAAADNFGVTGYTIYRNGAPLVTVGKVTSYKDTTVKSLATYSYTIEAYDQAGNHSAQSSAAAVTTPGLELFLPIITN